MYLGTGTMAGGRPRVSSQVLYQVETVIDDEGAFYTPRFRMTGAPNLRVTVSGPRNAPAIDVTALVYGPKLIGPLSGDLVGAERIVPISGPLPLVAATNEAATVLLDYIGEPWVSVAILDARPAPIGPFPVFITLTATS